MRWAERGVTVRQQAGFPDSVSSTTRVTVSGGGAEFALRVRVPQWATGRNTASVGGATVVVPPPGGWLEIRRAWRDGDVVDVHFPMGLWASRIQDDRPEFHDIYAWLYGPLVLAGITDTDSFTPPEGKEAAKPAGFIVRNSTGLEFEATGVDVLSLNRTRHVRLIPLFRVMDERYAVYFRTKGRKPVPYARGGAVVPSTEGDLTYSSGASSAGGPRDAQCSGMNVRSGNPGERARVTLAYPIVGGGRHVTEVALSYRYSAGYTPPAGTQRDAATLSVLLVDAETGVTSATVYTSPPLGNYSYDRFKGYSPVIPVHASGLRVPNTDPLFVALDFDNHQRNLQLPIDDLTGACWNVTVHWDNGVSSALPPFTHGRGVWWDDA